MNGIVGRWACFLAAIAMTAGACSDLTVDLERSAWDIPIEEIISLSRDGCCPLTADGEDRDAIHAAIPREASEIRITIKTDRGGFVEVGGAKEVTVRAHPIAGNDEHLRASVTFVADTLPGVATISATVKDHTNYLLIPMERSDESDAH